MEDLNSSQHKSVGYPWGWCNEWKREKKKIYLSHPITGESEDFFSKVTKFSSSLSQHYTIFDPYMIKDWAVVDAWRRVQNEATKTRGEVSSKIEFSVQYSEGLKE